MRISKLLVASPTPNHARVMLPRRIRVRLSPRDICPGSLRYTDTVFIRRFLLVLWLVLSGIPLLAYLPNAHGFYRSTSWFLEVLPGGFWLGERFQAQDGMFAQRLRWIPAWLPAAIGAACGAAAFVALRQTRIHRAGHCDSCGYNLIGNFSGTCPECGTVIADP